MSALPRPDVAGPARTLNDALHDLHHRAGWPSLRTLARETGVSHTTVSKVFSSAPLPTWGTLELLVEAMDGDVAQFHDLWLAASTPTDGARVPTGPRIAGRRAELDVVRHHLEAGTGLLLVTGEAGMGKTTLARAAVGRGDTLVAVGHCLPLSTEIPFLPIADTRRSCWEADAGRSVGRAVASCPGFVQASVGALLPEVATSPPGPTGASDDRSLLFTSLHLFLRALAAEQHVALLLEDLHWADGATLDLLEHLLGRGSPVPVVGTWRSGDDATPERSNEWLRRVRRLRDTAVVGLGPLTLAETADQLAILGRESARAGQIHARSQGQPLFTEQLAAHLHDQDPLPDVLADLLDRRLDGASRSSWVALRLLGVAARPLSPAVLSAASGLAPDLLTDELRSLVDRRLIRAASGTVELQHPLLAEAVQRRLAPGEDEATHRALARVLAAEDDSEPGKVAEHWRRGDRAEEEIGWRIAAASAAQSRFATQHAHAEWRRVLELRRSGVPLPPACVLTDAAIHVHAFDTGILFSEAAAMQALLESGFRADPTDDLRAALLRRTADLVFALGDESRGLEVLDEALALHDGLGLSSEAAHARQVRAIYLRQLGRWDEAVAAITEVLAQARGLDDLVRLKNALHVAAGLQADLGRGDEARALMAEATAIELPTANPMAEILLAANATDMLLVLGGTVEEVDAAAARGFDAARRFGYEVWATNTLRYNVALAHVRAGDTRGAAEVVEPGRDRPLVYGTRNGHVAVAFVDLHRGELASARDRLADVERLEGSDAIGFVEDHLHRAEVETWMGMTDQASARMSTAVDLLLTSGLARLAAPYLVWLARTQADCAASLRLEERDRVASDLETTVADATPHPFGPDAVGADVAALSAQWAAELARLRVRDTLEAWTRTATAWDELQRPHDAAYCRWRAAQCALREGQGTVAARLLKRAAADAREHVPLAQAIARTAAGGT